MTVLSLGSEKSILFASHGYDVHSSKASTSAAIHVKMILQTVTTYKTTKQRYVGLTGSARVTGQLTVVMLSSNMQ